MTQPSPHIIVAVKHLSRRFPGVLAIDDVSLEVFAGEVHALVGENGAGKSTLINMLAGVTLPSSGTIEVDGQQRVLNTPLSAQHAGIGVIFQEFNLLPHLSVAENIFLNREPLQGFVIDWPELNRRAREIMTTLGINLDLRAKVQDLSVAQQQLVEIARALSQDAKVIIMDEPTAALNEHEVAHLLDLTRGLAQRGVGVIYVSHRLAEVFAVADRISVLRDGRHILTVPTREITEDQVVAAMVGRELLHVQRPTRTAGDVVLEVRDLAVANAAREVTFDLHQGEVLALSGLMGSGSAQVLEALFGLQPITQGSVVMNGKPFVPRGPRSAQQMSIGYVPEDRKRAGILPDISVQHNFSISIIASLAHFGVISEKTEHQLLEQFREQLQMRYRDPNQPINSLSGGNQQKVVLARSLVRECQVLLLSEPTRGVDVGAKAEIYALIDALVGEGMAVLLNTSELPEVLRLADRCIVFAAGRPQGELTGSAINQEAVMHLATGLSSEEERVP